jgi:hypothetical protein
MGLLDSVLSGLMGGGGTSPIQGVFAIGVGAAALFGCYELGCFSHRSTTGAPNSARQQVQQPNNYQPH